MESKTEKSDIIGKGYGSCHNWERGHTMGMEKDGIIEDKATYYKCRDCDTEFLHFYDRVNNIFKAMKVCDIPNICLKNADTYSEFLLKAYYLHY